MFCPTISLSLLVCPPCVPRSCPHAHSSCRQESLRGTLGKVRRSKSMLTELVRLGAHSDEVSAVTCIQMVITVHNLSLSFYSKTLSIIRPH